MCYCMSNFGFLLRKEKEEKKERKDWDEKAKWKGCKGKVRKGKGGGMKKESEEKERA